MLGGVIFFLDHIKDFMKTLSVHQPYATLICSGVKTVENRTWVTNHRGKILIHASGDEFAWPDASYLPKSIISALMPYQGKCDITGICQVGQKYADLLKRVFAHYHQEFDPTSDLAWLKQAVKDHGFALPSQCIIGEVDIVDVCKNYTDDFSDHSCYNWVLANPIMYDKPIVNVVGRLRLWDHEVIS